MSTAYMHYYTIGKNFLSERIIGKYMRQKKKTVRKPTPPPCPYHQSEPGQRKSRRRKGPGPAGSSSNPPVLSDPLWETRQSIQR